MSVAALARGVERRALAFVAAVTAVVLFVLFYYPVGTVFVDAVRVSGEWTLTPLVEVLTSPFYLGIFRFTAYQALLSTVASVALGLPGA